MNSIKTSKITDRTQITTYDKEFSIDDKTCLMFMETTGLHANKSKLTLLSLAYNQDGSGNILQVFNFDNNEKSTIFEVISYIKNFECIQISNIWFQKYLEDKFKFYGHQTNLCFNNINVAMRHFYKKFKPGFDVNVAAIESIQIYKDAIRLNDKVKIDEYLAYNRNHVLAYQDWVENVKQ